MTSSAVRGRVYRCPVCGSEVAVIGSAMGRFAPRCCNTDMRLLPARLTFYTCPVCGSQIAVIGTAMGRFAPRCCNTDMRAEAA